jgi:hypothetical protein
MYQLILAVICVGIQARRSPFKSAGILSMSPGDLARELIASNEGLFDSPPPSTSPDAALAAKDRRNRDSEIPVKLGVTIDDHDYLDKLWNWVKDIAGYSVDSFLPYPLHSSNYINQYVYERSFDPSDSREPNIVADIIIDPSWTTDKSPTWSIWANGSSIPIFFSTNDSCTVSVVREAMLRLAEATSSCIGFIEVQSGGSNVLTVSSTGNDCYSSLGFSSGNNVINLGVGCVNVGTAMHLMGHALGMAHEDQRADSREYVAVNPSNIDVYGMSSSSNVDPTNTTKFHFVFEPLSGTKTAWESAILKQPYEYGSLWHNQRALYSVGPTDLTLIGSKGPQFEDLLGQRGIITERDARIINEMYSCQRLPVQVADRVFSRPLTPGTSYDTLNTCLKRDVQNFKVVTGDAQ